MSRPPRAVLARRIAPVRSPFEAFIRELELDQHSHRVIRAYEWYERLRLANHVLEETGDVRYSGRQPHHFRREVYDKPELTPNARVVLALVKSEAYRQINSLFLDHPQLANYLFEKIEHGMERDKAFLNSEAKHHAELLRHRVDQYGAELSAFLRGEGVGETPAADVDRQELREIFLRIEVLRTRFVALPYKGVGVRGEFVRLRESRNKVESYIAERFPEYAAPEARERLRRELMVPDYGELNGGSLSKEKYDASRRRMRS